MSIEFDLASFALGTVAGAVVFTSSYLATKRAQPERHTLAELGPMLRAERERRGITQVQAAAECGLHNSMLGKVERGWTPRSIEVLQKCAGWLGLTPNDFELKATEAGESDQPIHWSPVYRAAHSEARDGDLIRGAMKPQEVTCGACLAVLDEAAVLVVQLEGTE